MSFLPFFLSKGLDQDSAVRAAEQLTEIYPWLDFKSEISESLAIDLLSAGSKEEWRSFASVDELVDWYNEEVRRQVFGHQQGFEGEDAYADLCGVVSHFGAEDAFGDGDFWVVADSFSGLSPNIISFKRGPLPEELFEALKAWRSRHSEFTQVSISDEDGNIKVQV